MNRSEKRSRRRETERDLRRAWLHYWWVWCDECGQVTRPRQVAFNAHTPAADSSLPGRPATERDMLPALYMETAQADHLADTGHQAYITGGIDADETETRSCPDE